MYRILRVVIVTCLLIGLAHAAFAASGGITVSVTGGKQLATDAVVERELDLAGAAKVLGVASPVDPEAVRVVEVGKDGNLPSQVDPSGNGKYVVCWQVPGELAPGKTRTFKILLTGDGNVPTPKAVVSATQQGDDVVVTQGNVTLTYSKSIGGLLSKMTVGGVSASFTWMDKIYDGTVYYLATHSADKTRIIASGPLRAVYETQSTYSGDGKAESKPRATYTFTHYAGEPIARLDARMTQDFAHNWMSLHVVEIHFDGSPIDSYITDSVSGKFIQNGQFSGGPRWAAVYGPGLLIGVYGKGVGIYDGGGQYYGSYVRGSTETVSKSDYQTRAALYFGTSPAEAPIMTAWEGALASGPVLSVSLDALDRQTQQVRTALQKKSKSLSALKGNAWVAAYAQVTVAGAKLASGVASLGAGDFGKAGNALKEAQSLLGTGKARMQSTTRNGVTQGTVDGYPFVANSRVAYLFARSAEGFGLISVYDKVRQREYLAADPKRASLWQISVKQTGSGRVISNLSDSSRSVRQTKNGLELVWKGDIGARVSLVLPANSPRIAMRLTANVTKPGLGIQNVSFPEIAGILPLTPGGKDDVVLDTSSVGDLKPSPLVTGSNQRQEYPACMQFTALQSGDVGFYAAEQDPQANIKVFSWDPDVQSGTLSYSVSHAVLGWASDTLVTSYKSPGDVVVGPFQGDWYDACQIYRKWVLTGAPWTAKGPMYKRADYPKWMADSPYWTIGYLDSEINIKNEVKKFEFFGIPTGICHTYGYYFPQTQDDRYPEYFPPKLGSENLKRVIKELHAKGMHFVPYINGWCWDQDTESYQVEDADNKAAIQTSDGGQIVMDSYGYGQKLAGMCPGSELWQKKLVDASKELVGRYDFDGVYYDFFTIHTMDCFNKTHGHPISGGNFWTSSIRKCYTQCRAELKKIRPDVMMTGEDNAEFVIDLLDTQLSLSRANDKAPLYNAVYHGYTLLYGGGKQNYSHPAAQGRWWLTGGQNGWTGAEGAYKDLQRIPQWKADGEFFKRLLACHYYFARPYLAYGTMLRPPKVTGKIPKVNADSGMGPFSISAIDGTAWKAPDGSVGIFFLNYSDDPLEFKWNVDLAEYAGWGKGAKLKLTQWTEDKKLVSLGVFGGGKLNRQESLAGRGLIALKLEVVK